MGVEPFATDTDVMEAKFVARRIQQLTDVKKKKGAQPEAIFKLHEVAVLYRTKMQVTTQTPTQFRLKQTYAVVG